jgi:hypothetical protein
MLTNIENNVTTSAPYTGIVNLKFQIGMEEALYFYDKYRHLVWLCMWRMIGHMTNCVLRKRQGSLLAPSYT